MKLLLDSCMSRVAVSALAEAGYDVEYTGDWLKDPGDREILAYAFAEHRILITLDKDFGEHISVDGLPHVGLIRLVNISVKDQAAACLQILTQYQAELEAAALVTAEPGFVRIRSHH